MIGDGARVLVGRALAATRGAVSDSDIDRATAAFERRYIAAPCVHTTLMPGARAALSLGVPCALVTNKPRAVAALVVEALGIAPALAAVFAGGDGPLKPAPDGILTVAAALGVAASRAWMIGDGHQDVLAGRAAGAFTVAVPGIAARERVLATGPDVVLGSLEELAALVAVTSA